MNMQLCPLYSGSSGNALFVQYGETRVLVDAGRHFLEADADEATLVQTAVRAMGLDDIKPFDPQKKVIEYLLKETI